MAAPPGDKPKRRLFRLLRRGSRESINAAARTAVEESALWTSHERASAAVRESGEAAQRIASHVAKQRGVVDALADRARGVSGRSNDLSAGFTRLRDTFARLELVALNAGLEGARLGEGPGQALGLVSDEVRAQATRGSEACRELALALGEIGSELTQVHASLDRAREASGEVAQEAARVGGASADAERALAEIGDRLKTTTGSDPETARAIADATEHARSLVAALGALTGKVPQALVVAALRPVLEPLLRQLEGDEEPER
jgi:ABC-type transporter Mla subunit MlaD